MKATNSRKAIPDIDEIVKKLGCGRVELVTFATFIARSKKMKPTEALIYLQQSSLTAEELRMNIINTLRLPTAEKEESSDTSTQSE